VINSLQIAPYAHYNVEKYRKKKEKRSAKYIKNVIDTSPHTDISENHK
jgi:hypothetical protein